MSKLWAKFGRNYKSVTYLHIRKALWNRPRLVFWFLFATGIMSVLVVIETVYYPLSLFFFYQRYFFKWAIPGLFFIYFCLFKQTLQFLQQIYVEKCYVHPVYGAGIRTYEHESPPITTRPGLPPTTTYAIITS